MLGAIGFSAFSLTLHTPHIFVQHQIKQRQGYAVISVHISEIHLSLCTGGAVGGTAEGGVAHVLWKELG